MYLFREEEERYFNDESQKERTREINEQMTFIFKEFKKAIDWRSFEKLDGKELNATILKKFMRENSELIYEPWYNYNNQLAYYGFRNNNIFIRFVRRYSCFTLNIYKIKKIVKNDNIYTAAKNKGCYYSICDYEKYITINLSTYPNYDEFNFEEFKRDFCNCERAYCPNSKKEIKEPFNIQKTINLYIDELEKRSLYITRKAIKEALESRSKNEDDFKNLKHQKEEIHEEIQKLNDFKKNIKIFEKIQKLKNSNLFNQFLTKELLANI